MEFETFLEILSWKELIALAKILGVGLENKRRGGVEESIARAVEARYRIWLKSGERVQVRFKPDYDDGWKWCSRCHTSFRRTSGNDLITCPICGHKLSSDSRVKCRQIPRP